MLRSIIFTSLFLSVTPTQAQMNGGQLKVAKYYKIELVECYEYVTVYLYDANMCPLLNSGINGFVSFEYRNARSINSELYPYGVDAFTAKIFEDGYITCTVHLDLFRHPIKATFESRLQLLDDSNAVSNSYLEVIE